MAHVNVVRRDPDGGALLCTALQPPGETALLRCRFPAAEVPATSCARGVSCHPPADGPETAAAFQVLADDELLAEGVYDKSPAPAKPGGGLRPFAIISLAYLLYTTTDGAIRMIVLLRAYQLGFSAWLVAVMFSLYELAGVGTNVAAGLLGSRWGLRATLVVGLLLQLAGISLLYGFTPAWAAPGQQWKGLVYVTFTQGLCGVAKDLTKLGGKTVTKLVTPAEKQQSLFHLVSALTGWKNSMKGVGYFIGSAAVALDFRFALGLLLFLILLPLPPVALGLAADLGRARNKSVTMRQLLTPSSNVARLSLARAFLFASRDLWFEVPLPFFLRDRAQGLGWARPATGAALAGFIIIYGQVQAQTPRLLQPLRQTPANKQVQVLWNAALTAVPAALAAVFLGSPVFTRGAQGAKVAVLLAGLAAFCVVFAVNSAVHSYLIVRYSGDDKVAATVGFYYMANAVGRLVGTLLSGAIYEYASPVKAVALGYCFAASALFSLTSTLLTLRIDDQLAGLACGPCWLVKPRAEAEPAATAGAEPEAPPPLGPPTPEAMPPRGERL